MIVDMEVHGGSIHLTSQAAVERPHWHVGASITLSIDDGSFRTFVVMLPEEATKFATQLLQMATELSPKHSG